MLIRFSFFFFLLVLASSVVLGQQDEERAKKLVDRLESLSSDAEKLQIYKEIIEAYTPIDLDQAARLADQGIEEAIKQGNKKWQAELIKTKAQAYNFHARWRESNRLLDDALEICKQEKDERGEANVLNIKGDNLYRLGRISAALEDTETAFEIGDKLSDPMIKATSLLRIGRIYTRQNNYERALDYYRQNLDIYKDKPMVAERAQALNNIGDANMNLKRYQAAIDTLHIAISINSKINRQDQLVYNLTTLGEIHVQLSSYDSASLYFEQALDLSIQLKNDFTTSYIYSAIGILLMEKGQSNEALGSLYKAYTLGTNSDEVTNKTVNSLQKAYQQLGQYDSAYKYLRIYQQNSEAAINREFKKTQDLLQQIDNEKRDVQEAHLIEAEEARITFLITVITGGAIVTLILIVVVVIIYLQRQKQKQINLELLDKNKEIQHQNKSIAEQSNKLETALNNLTLLNLISRKIMVNLSVEDIVATVNKNVAILFSNDGFGIGIHNPERNTIEFDGYIEKGKMLDHSSDNLDDDDNLSAYCFKNGSEIIVNSYSKEYKKYVTIPKAPNVGGVSESIIYIPLKTKGGVTGVITLQNEKAGAYDEYSIRMVQNLANIVSIAIENANAYQGIRSSEQEIQEQKGLIEVKNKELISQRNEVQDSYENIKLLSKLGTEITSHLSVVDIIQKVYESINSLINAELFSIGVYNPITDTIDLPNTIEKGKVLPPHSYELDNENRMAVVCFKNVEEILINDLRKEFRKYLPNAGTLTADVGDVPESLIYLPLIGREKTLGTLSVQSFTSNAYSENDLNLLRNLAIYITVALENAESYKQIKASNEEVASQKAEIQASNVKLAQKNQEVEDSYKNIKLLGDLGKGIVTKLSVPKIISTVYKTINTLMDATVFWIGIYEKNTDQLYFEGAYEHDEPLAPFRIPMTDEERLAVYCFNHQKEINIRDFGVEYKKYFHTLKPAVAGRNAKSIIYIPLTTINKRIGVLTIQSYKKEVYSDYQLNIIRNLAVYTVIALENALLYKNLEGEVVERTAQIVAQKEELEKQKDIVENSFKNIQLLSDIGQKITRILSIEDIIETVYENVNNLMDANAFGIGILRSGKNIVEFIGAMESGERLPTFTHDISDLTRYSVWCINNKKEVILNDALIEYKKYISSKSKPIAGEDPNSIIYLPLIYKNEAIGCITVQSMQMKAYNEYHLEMLRTLAVYAAIAIENAKAYQEIETKSREIAKKTQKIRSSINYAKRIQRAMLPERSELQKHLLDAFIMFKPKDVVSGDFYWFMEKGDKIFLAAVDCTGHGVPGAIMSMIGSVLLSEIINLMGLEEPDLILNTLHLDIREALKQENTNNRDGMDISLCVIDRRNRKIEYAGAKQPLVYVTHDEKGTPTLHTIKGDKAPIGGIQREKERIFQRHTIQFPPLGDGPKSYKDYTNFYLFSDGYQDQFGMPDGGTESRKMMLKNMKEAFLKMHQIPMVEQHKILDDMLLDWQKDEPQIDDILVLGFRV